MRFTPRYNLLRHPVPVIAEWVWTRLARKERMVLYVAPDGTVTLRGHWRTDLLPFDWMLGTYAPNATLREITDDLDARLREIAVGVAA